MGLSLVKAKRFLSTIIDERGAVPDDDVSFQGHGFTNKLVTRTFAVRADSGVLLDLDKRFNLDLVGNLTIISVDDTKNAHIAPWLYVWRDPLVCPTAVAHMARGPT